MANIDRLIARFLPAIGAAFLAGGAGYLIYSSIWPNVPYEVRIGIGGIAALALAFLGTAVRLPSKFFADALTSVGILIGYATLIYASRTAEAQAALLPENASLLVAFVFSAAASLVSASQKSKTVLLSSILGAYLTPFFIGQVDEWRYVLGYHAYLSYFLAVNVAMFVASRKMNLSEIIPINGVSLMVATVAMRAFGFSSGISPETVQLTFFLHVLIVAALVFAIFRSEWNRGEASKGVAAFAWVAPALWFLGNAYSFRHSVSNEFRATFEIALGLGFFGIWHFMKGSGKRAPGAYVSGVLLVTVGVLVFLADSLEYAGVAMSAIGALLLGLGIFDGKQSERLFSGIAFAAVGAFITAFATAHLWNNGTLDRFLATFAVSISLLPILSLSFIKKDEFPEDWKSLAEFSAAAAWISFGLMAFFNIVTIKLDPIVLFFFLPSFVIAAALTLFPVVPENGRRIANGVAVWSAIGGAFAFFPILDGIFDHPQRASLHGVLGAYAALGGGTFAMLLATKKRFGTEFKVLGKFFIAYAFFAAHFLIIGALNDTFGMNVEGLRAVATTVYWVAASIVTLSVGLERRNGGLKRLGFAALAFTVVKIVFYDLGNATTELKVAVLMVVGAALLGFSWYATKRGMLASDDAEDETEEAPAVRVAAKNPEPAPVVNRAIESMDLGDVTSASVVPLGAAAFKVNSKNLLKIMKLVVEKFGMREVYLPGELLPAYESIIKNYKSELPKASYDSVASTMKDFCKRGGSVTFK